MQLNKRQTYFAVLIVGIGICLLYQSFWIFSSTTQAKILSTVVYRSNKGDINWMKASYTVNYLTHYGYYLKDGYDVEKRYFEIRYLLFAPDISRTNNFISNWGTLMMFYFVWLLITSIVFLRKDIVADQAVFLLNGRPPFLKLANNEIEDYDQHDVVLEKLSGADSDIYESIQKEKSLAGTGEVRTDLYQFNPNAILIIVVYVFYFFWYFVKFLSLRFSMAEYIIYGAILVFIPIYVQNTHNSRFKMKIPDPGVLVFSSRGVDYKQFSCPIAVIESAVVYLESFNGFVYRDRTTTGYSKTRLYGDNNKISFRNNGGVTDFTFILNSAKDYWTFKKVMTDWSAMGVNVILETVFEDDYIIQEMVHFHILNA